MTNTPDTPETSVDSVGRVSIVIVSCNRVSELRTCLSTLGASVENAGIQIIAVDNGSEDGSGALDAEFPAVQFIRLPRNFGLTKALNLGIRAATGDYVLLMHEDVEIALDAVGALRDALVQRSEMGAACPLLLDASGNAAPQIRDLPSPANPDPPFRPGRTGEVPAVSSAAVMVRRFLLNALGNIDERYGNYGSDIELSMQVQRANKKIVILDGATAIHRSETNDPAAEAAADRMIGTAVFLGKYHGFWSKLKYQAGAALRTLFTFRLGTLKYLLSGQKIDGA